ncbi:hypothetical protein AUEXF2481DRAFT_92286 [Aureobasidium subglaciale EXF-2481]|uniref:Uncharacterized protein n=1 Tax=Aureobasidium subglaciale (strain EXF-2481) TaxID=1043005 RepID=A0A074Y0M3_AURSE|nr:uncharacterized protein AUEXF2481DRAFT_92286 [Aureobasidium subglaciale EXF-2481]KAI5198505.1 hypothetical protein E4T38_07449 [Aureobasidium subglaciale]KAI5217343.1 hypothetical protein E4T40_07460 [Aureobasidium subglaciale]KAI5220890.1 hypothetical protein E4T41_07301 [Aureobasidium subglaciale]KAI5258508.1 hypothetical protein E4T46_07278 [Aureobasidium subglaciale]KEQ91275.1 hypothetical protein AUEXF2481DRAFT_92286 [Aureobasidium subglaciale EXF-2481]
MQKAVNMSSYFDVLSWTRARKNREALEKTNPQNPVLNDDDEQFLERITSQEAPAPPLPTIEPTVIDDEGNKREANATQKEAAEMILPASPGESKEKRTWASYIPNVPNVAVPNMSNIPSIPVMPSLASLRGNKASAKADDKEASQSEDSEVKAAEQKPVEKKETHAEKAAAPVQDDKNDLTEKAEEIVQATTEVAQETKDELTKDSATASEAEATKDTGDDKSEETTQRTWASYIPAIPAMSAIPTIGRSTKAKEEAEEAARNQTPEAKEQNEREVSVLLDNLNLSAINNRVFSFSDQSQKLYGEFTLILKDIVNGVPTAYEDLETLLKNNEKHLEQMFKNMPPFVQTLVKSLPTKFATSMGPEIMAMAGDEPGHDLKKRMETVSQASSSAAAGVQNVNLDVKKKQKRKIPNIKDLAKQKGAVTSMLTNIVNFLKVRFPAFVTGTNVVMSLSVFILLFVFWYCHKRGKEVRMLRESEPTKASSSSANISELSDSAESSEDEVEEKKDAMDIDEESDTEEEKIKAAKAYAAGMQKSAVGGPDNAAALRAKRVLEQD